MTPSRQEQRSAAFRPVRPTHAYEHVVEQIEDAIVNGRLGPHDRLPSERALMREFQVGRSTVREALRVLQSKGLVRSRPGDPNGPLVLPLSTEGLRASMYTLARMDDLTLRELLQFRMIVEASAYRLAALRRSEAHLSDLRAALEAMWEAVPRGREAFTAADLDFHDVVADAAANKLLSISSSVVRDIVGRLVQARIGEAADEEELMRENCQRHALVLAAVADGDAQRAAMLARYNLYDYYATYLSDEDREAVAALLVDEPAVGVLGGDPS